MNCFLTTGVPCVLSRSRRPDAFEAHVTLTPLHEAERARFAAICSQQRWKALVIELDPHIPSQPMTCSRIAGTAEEARSHALFVQQHLEQCGFTTTRVKIEAAPWNSFVPQTDQEAMQRHHSAYFEFHAKLVLAMTGWESTLPAVCLPFQAHISHNSFRKRDDTTMERFVTMRSALYGLDTFQQHANQLTAALGASDFSVADTVMEYCIYDSNAGLDAVWFTTSPIV
jgi:hypothetical protein